MKKLTLELYDKIIDKVYDESKYHFNLLGSVTHDVCAEYIGFYAHHGGLFWSEKDGEICGVATAHPGKRDFDWKWSDEAGDWTAHIIWAFSSKAKAELLREFIGQQTIPTRLWACRRGSIVELNQKKLERIFSYGRRRNHNSSTGNAELQRVDEVYPAIADRPSASSVCAGV